MMSRWTDGDCDTMETRIYTLGHGDVWIFLSYWLFSLIKSGSGREGTPSILH